MKCAITSCLVSPFLCRFPTRRLDRDKRSIERRGLKLASPLILLRQCVPTYMGYSMSDQDRVGGDISAHAGFDQSAEDVHTPASQCLPAMPLPRLHRASASLPMVDAKSPPTPVLPHQLPTNLTASSLSTPFLYARGPESAWINAFREGGGGRQTKERAPQVPCVSESRRRWIHASMNPSMRAEPASCLPGTVQGI